MAVTASFRFPLGRFHATGWDHSVNEGIVEWPPSPWRLLRALVATWYTRWPDLPASTLDGILDALGDPPTYATPPVSLAHTRHYLPDPSHRKGETGNTDLTLDPYLSIDRDARLFVRWEADLTGEQRTVLAKLLELLPYLGRADSICEGRLEEDAPEPDDTWWRPRAGGEDTVRLLAPVPPVRRPVLEVSTVDVRRARRTVPPETRWVTYSRTTPQKTPTARPHIPRVTAVRLAVVSAAPVRATHGILLADEIHRLAARRVPAGRSATLFASGGASTDHRHAHWTPIPDGHEPGATVGSVLLWSPDGFDPDEVNAILGIRRITGQRRGRDNGDEGYEVKGLPVADLLLQSAGADVAQVAPELCQPARRWRSLTPYLPVRHHHPNRWTLDEYLTRDVHAELRYRGVAELPAVSRIDPDDGLPDRWSRDFRRYRMKERLDKARRGIGLRLEFPEPVPGKLLPMLLGQLSHFGYGTFVPEPE